MTGNTMVGIATLLALGAAKVGCGSDAEPPAATGAGGGMGKAGKAGSSGKSGVAGQSGGKAGTSGQGGSGVVGGAAASGSAGCPDIVPSGVDGFVEVPPCPKEYDCGPGCTPVFSASYGSVHYSDFRVDGAGVIDSARRALFFAGTANGVSVQFGLPEGNSAFLSPTLSPGYLVARHYTKPEPKEADKQNILHVYDRTNGKLVHAWPMPGTPGGPSQIFFGAAATDKYALFSNGASLLRFNIADGTLKFLAESNCYTAQIVNGKYTCADENTYMFTQTDIESGEVTQLAPGPSLQADGSCALDGSACAWVDYRDPPGNKSDLFNRIGGDVYLFDFASRQLKRLTFDSPDTPHLKYGPMVEGEWVVWQHRAALVTIAGGLIVPNFDRVSRQNLKSGLRCTFPVKNLVAGNLRQHTLVALHTEFETGYHRVVSIDLDSPDIPWECGPAPAPVLVQWHLRVTSECLSGPNPGLPRATPPGSETGSIGVWRGCRDDP